MALTIDQLNATNAKIQAALDATIEAANSCGAAEGAFQALQESILSLQQARREVLMEIAVIRGFEDLQRRKLALLGA